MSGFLPILPPLQNAILELTSLQRAASIDSEISHQQVQQAYASLLPVADLLPAGTVEEIDLVLPDLPPNEGAAHLIEHLPLLVQKKTELSRPDASFYTEADAASLQQITGETHRATGAFPVNPLPAQPIQAPDWARELSVRCITDDPNTPYEYPLILNQQGSAVVGISAEAGATVVLSYDFLSPAHFEIRFMNNGKYWIRDLGSELGTSVDGQLLEPMRWYPLRKDKLLSFSAGEGLPVNVFGLSFPEPPPLEMLRDQIERTNSLDEISDLLLDNDMEEIADAIEVFQADGVDLSQIPETGGLRRKVRQLILSQQFEEVERAFDLIHVKYMQGLPAAVAYSFFRTTSESVRKATTRKELLDALVNSPIPGMSRIIPAVKRFLSGKTKTASKIPPEFGIRTKATEIRTL